MISWSKEAISERWEMISWSGEAIPSFGWGSFPSDSMQQTTTYNDRADEDKSRRQTTPSSNIELHPEKFFFNPTIDYGALRCQPMLIIPYF